VVAGTMAAIGGAASDAVFQVEGALAVTTDADGSWIMPRNATILNVYITCKDPGSASSTIVDVNLNGTSIFNTTQANRPTLAWDDADGVAKSGAPDTTSLVENDVLTIDIDQIGTDAADLTVIVAFDVTAIDSDAIHDNVASEISAITEKTTPIAADMLIIEDSADSNNKKMVQIGNLPKVVRQTIFTVSGDLTVDSNPLRIYNKLGANQTISEVFIVASTAPVGAAILVDVNLDGTTIFTNQAHRPTIADGANTGTTTDIDVATWTDDSYLTIDVDQIGSGTAGADLVVHIIHS